MEDNVTLRRGDFEKNIIKDTQYIYITQKIDNKCHYPVSYPPREMAEMHHHYFISPCSYLAKLIHIHLSMLSVSPCFPSFHAVHLLALSISLCCPSLSVVHLLMLSIS